MELLYLIVSAIVILLVGTKLTEAADRIADRTGLGEALIGAVLLGASTSLPGITASVVAAVDGYPALALSNAFGGIAAQTAFLAVADITYRKINLEHAAASQENMMQGALLISLLSLLLFAISSPPFEFFGVNVITVILFLSYAAGLRLIYKTKSDPMWKPTQTKYTVKDVIDFEDSFKDSLTKIWFVFIVSAVLVIAAGWILTKSAEVLASEWGLNESFVGALIIAVITSLPELVTSIAAVKRGALNLAVGGILGGNVFDTLFAGAADIAYRDGSIYHSAGDAEIMILSLSIIMTSVLILGLLRREKKGFANIGFESAIVLSLYIVGAVLIFLSN